MNMDLRNLREDLKFKEFTEEMAGDDPFDLFQEWYQEALKAQLVQPNYLTLSTANKKGHPSSRIVLLKEVEEKKFIFFTNYNSQKAQEIIENPFVSLNFYWVAINRQVSIRGVCQKTMRSKSEDYFASRPRDSQIAAVISKQSEITPSRDNMEAEFSRYKNEYEGKEIPCPEYWGGFEVTPSEFEFWQGRESRLHDRIFFEWNKSKNSWNRTRKYP
ncbi:MAG: pyridoxamine 5'-phosphate oxidase [Halobacteriovoraceae bacterium]|nr:pyridoxamine 5'-phosphate oxidase [Halobacteriovoraceae bacterium]